MCSNGVVSKQEASEGTVTPGTSSYENPSYDPKELYVAEDDAQVCSVVPMKERKIVFEQLEKVNRGYEEKQRGGRQCLNPIVLVQSQNFLDYMFLLY